ncbi:MAG: hypothetical protein K1Y36_10965 [Blastocatellia bacterium]|nr:hypothetical protein [Blastocatellia bacterium]
MTTTNEIHDLMYQAHQLEDGDPAKIALFEQAINLADSSQNDRLAFAARNSLIDAATFGGQFHKAMAAFAWCLAQSDKQQTFTSLWNLLWKYKWMVMNAPRYPQIEKPQLEKMFTDAQERFQAYGASLRPLYRAMADNAESLWGEAKRRELLELYLSARRDSLADCSTCELAYEVGEAERFDDPATVIRKAQPILEGRLTCRSQPHGVLAQVLLSLVRLGWLTEAETCHQRGYRLIRTNPNYLWEMASHITYLTLTGNLSRALKLFERHLGWVINTKERAAHFYFLLAVWFLLEQVGETRKRPLKLTLLATFPLFREDRTYQVADLKAWFQKETETLAGRFNRRNGNDYFDRQIREHFDLKELAERVRLQASQPPAGD